MTLAQLDLFGAPPKPERRSTVPQGHVMHPGSGPEGETCGTCAHAVHFRRSASKAWYKCGLNTGRWTYSRFTDIRVSDPACSKWGKR